MRLDLRLPSSATAISWLALFVALGGTAFGAAATLVKLEGATGGHIADVDRTGALSTTATPAAPRVPFFGFAFVVAGSTATLIGPSTSTAVLTSFTFGNNSDQTNGAHARIALTVTQSSTSSCTGDAGSPLLSIYYAAAGQSFQATYPNGLVLKPTAAGRSWCLKADTLIQGNPGGYFLPEVSWIGYVERGSLVPPPALPNAAELAMNPPRHR